MIRTTSFCMRLLFVLGWLCYAACAYGRGDDDSVAVTGRLHTDLPVLNTGGQLTATVYYDQVSAKEAVLTYRCYKYSANGDSILVCRKEAPPLTLDGTLHRQTLVFTSSDGPAWYLPVFYHILRKTGTPPPGPYKVLLELKNKTTLTVPIRRSFTHQSDSSLPPTSPLRKELNHALLPQSKAPLAGAAARTLNALAAGTEKALDRSAGRVARLFKAQGLTSVTERRNATQYINLYYEDWFVGRYQTELTQSLDAQVQSQASALAAPVTSLVTNELESYRSLLSQVKDLTKLKKEERQLSGELALTGNWANNPDPYSAQENNYYELRGNIETTVQDLPVSIEGYYTTQDRNRTIKASYIRIHYDAEKAKSELMQLIGGFKDQFAQTLSKGAGLQQVYGSYLDNLKGEERILLDELKKETGVTDLNTSSLDTAGLKSAILDGLKQKVTDTAGADSTGTGAALQRTAAGASRLADSARLRYQQALKKYQRLVALEQQARKYYALLEQYRNTAYFDSTLGYGQLKDLDHADGATYKQLAKSAAGLLPEGKVKKFATGLTSLDAGIFPKELSSYTMAGQQLKGLDAGYDLGFCQVGATIGSTEFAGRDGTLDKYTAYSGRAQFRPFKDQKVTLIYYGYTPSRKALTQDTFFKNMDLALPSFREPVHIVSAAYAGTIAKNVTIDGEVATSFQKGSGEGPGNKLSADKIAWHLSAAGAIPKTSLSLEAGYEHGGKDFQNSTLPLSISGTDLLKASVRGDFFRSFLTLGVEFNHIEQHSFASTGSNNRWGFEIATHSRQYPSVSLSYKPYTTFRSYTDTLAVPQRPLLGAVWTGRATYQIKQTGGRAWRFSAVYNKSTSEIDTTSYGSNLVQASLIYSTRSWMVSGSVGNADQSSTGLPATDGAARSRTTFGMVSGSCPVSRSVQISAGGDIGFAPFGLSKYGLSGGVSWRMGRVPLTVRAAGRYGRYELSKAEGWQQLYGGSLELIWQFKMKLSK